MIHQLTEFAKFHSAVDLEPARYMPQGGTRGKRGMQVHLLPAVLRGHS